MTDAEGSFSIIHNKDNRAKFNTSIRLRFKITMLNNEIELINKVKNFFNCGYISNEKNHTVNFLVNDLESIRNVILPHFNKYPLRGTKYLDYMSFKDASEIINSKYHLTEEGRAKLIIINNNMNRFTNYYSPDHTKEENFNFIPLTGDYINGFIAGDGCLSGVNFGRMSLQISQHINNKLFLISIANYFDSPTKVYSHGLESLQITLSGKKLWNNNIFPHFKKYFLFGSKNITLEKLIVINKLMVNNEHIIQIGRYREWKPEVKLQIINIWYNQDII